MVLRGGGWAHPAMKLILATFHLAVLHLSGQILISDVVVQWSKKQIYIIYNYHGGNVLILVLEDLETFSWKPNAQIGYLFSKTKKPFGLMNINIDDLIKLSWHYILPAPCLCYKQALCVSLLSFKREVTLQSVNILCLAILGNLLLFPLCHQKLKMRNKTCCSFLSF